MTTRSGRGYKRVDMDENATQTGEGGPSDRDVAVGPQGASTTPDIASLMQVLLEDRRRREEEIAEERVRREKEVDQRVGQMKEQMEAMFKLVEKTTKGKASLGKALV